jgi:hypothetical protein
MHALAWTFFISSILASDSPADDRANASTTDNSRATGGAAVNYTKHVAPIVFKRCVSCHRPGEVAPFTLTSYEKTVKWAETIREVVEQRRMPPWLANPNHGSFANEARLTDSELSTILEWIDSGTPEGNPADLPPLPKFTDGWRIPEPDLILEMPQSFRVPATGTVNYQYFTIDPGLKEDMWVRAAEARPGSRPVVHHIVLLVQAPGDRPVRETGGLGSELLATFAPGLPPTSFDDGFAKLIPAGSKFVLQVHYTPNGTEQTDLSKVGLVFAKPETVRKRVRGAFALNFQFRIPPGADSYPVEADYKFGQDSTLVSLFPHMHLRGKSFQFEARYPDGTKEILLDVPRWDFNWQNAYVLAKPKRIPEGTVLHCSASFDNSAENPANPDPKSAVTFGEQTWQEMMVGYLDVALADQDLTAGGPQVKPLKPGEFEVLFRYKPTEAAKTVHLAGTFTEWKTSALAMDGPDADGRFKARVKLPAGTHEYKFLIDGAKWRQDPANYRQAGGYNNSAIVLAGEPASGETASKPVVNGLPIDLQPRGNQVLKEDFSDVTNGNNLASLPSGDQVLLGVPFRIGPRMIALGSTSKPERPTRVDGIVVNGQVGKLHILHATEFGEGEPGSENHVADGTTIGKYIVHYEDQSQETIPVKYGDDVRDWWFNVLTKTPTRGKVAWKGTNAYSTELNCQIRLYLTSWQNPKPSVRVSHVDFVSAETAAAPFCVAISAEPK